jgi:hypothetical protein
VATVYRGSRPVTTATPEHPIEDEDDDSLPDVAFRSFRRLGEVGSTRTRMTYP